MNETLSKYYASISGYMEKLNALTEATEDVNQAKFYVLISALIAMTIGFIWMIIMKTCAGPLTWTTIVLFTVACFLITYYLYDSGTKRQKEIDEMTLAPGESKPKNYRVYMSYVGMVCCLILVCTIVCFYSRIRIAIKIMEASADFVTEVPLVLLVPPIISIVTVVWCLVWIYLAVYVYSTGEFNPAYEGAFYAKVKWTG